MLTALAVILAPWLTGESSATNHVVAEFGDEVITAEALERSLVLPLAEIQEQAYEVKRKKLEELIAERLLRREAAKRGLTVEKLLAVEVAAKASPVTREEVNGVYEKNRDRLSGDEKAVKGQIAEVLRGQRQTALQQEFVNRLKSQHRVVMRLERPPPVRVALAPREGAASRGPSDAPVTIVEFSDFECPYCRRAIASLDKVFAAYPREVRLVYRHFPLESIHPQARGAAEAAECAGAQGRFWEYHDQLFAEPGDLTPAKLRELAQGLGLDLARFERCRVDGEFRGRVAEDIAAATQLGVTGTPTFFVNGRPLVGARPFEAFKAIIDQELGASAFTARPAAQP